MEKNCEVYIDPEEDEVFFGCISDKEKALHADLANEKESDPQDGHQNKTLEPFDLHVDEENNKNILMNEKSGTISKEVVINDSSILATDQHNNSVEMDHNYSTPIKPKIDKSILSTPKSIVKADKDGGFLKVLSEIALVKAEAENDKKTNKREDEDKENKINQQIPEIKVTEATPERLILSPPNNNVNMRPRQFRIIYRSPKENKFDQKSHSDSEKDVKKMFNEYPKNKRKSIDLIDWNDLDNLNNAHEESDKESGVYDDCALIKEIKKSGAGVRTTTVCESPKEVKVTVADVKSPPKIEPVKPPKGLRFSKEARKIVEVLKKSTVDDTLNFTIPEIDVENEENSFVCPEPVELDKTELLIEEMEKTIPKQKFLCKTIEKERPTPTLLENNEQPFKHFSERKINQGERNGIKTCVRKLPLEEKKTIDKIKELTSSKTSVFGMKNSKIPLSDRIPRALPLKSTSKTPLKTISKNPKFNHIESPINAYIHSKQTALVVNVKPEPKKKPPSGIAKLQTSAKKPTQTKLETRSIPVKEKSSKLQTSSAIRLPFVEYRSATPYKIEKASESRLPRLAPSVQKLIGTNSPRVLKHEGRFYLTTPRKGNSTENSTIVADPNEVSVVVCQSAQKSNTIK